MKRWGLLILLSLGLYLADSRGVFGWLVPLRRQIFQNKQPATINVIDAEKAVLEADALKLKGENEYLRKLLGANFPASWQLQPAKIIKINKDDLMIDSGQKSGIQPGMIILALDKVAIAKVVRVNPAQAEAKFITDVQVRTESGARGKLQRQNQSLILSEVRQEFELKRGELVVTAGRDGWPPDLAVGRVGQIEKPAASIYQSAIIEPVINYSSLTEVAVLLEPVFN